MVKEEKLKQVKAWRESGLSQRQYAMSCGILPATFNYWCKLLEIKNYRQAPFAEIRGDVWRV